MSNTITVVDSDGNTYVLAEPSEFGVAHYVETTRDGHTLVVIKLNRDAVKPQFALAPAEPSKGEVALKQALDEFRDDPPVDVRGGYDEGYDEGYSEGYNVGFQDGRGGDE